MFNQKAGIMNKIAILLVLIFLSPFFGITQSIKEVDFISPFNNGLAAIKKGNEWAFINTKGEQVIDFRSDLVLTKTTNFKYPLFNSDRCLIVEKREGISYFGYIDTFGKTIIEPQFLNATDFNDSMAIALELVKQDLGNNDLLDIPVVSYDYFEVVIDTNGIVKHYLILEPVHIALSKKHLRQPPKITAKVLSSSVYAIYGKDNKWEIKKFEMNE